MMCLSPRPLLLLSLCLAMLASSAAMPLGQQDQQGQQGHQGHQDQQDQQKPEDQEDQQGPNQDQQKDQEDQHVQTQMYSQLRSYLVTKLATLTEEQKLRFARKLWGRLHCRMVGDTRIESSRGPWVNDGDLLARIL